MEVTPAPFNEKLIVKYLLGELAEDECVEIENRAFQDEQYQQVIIDVETDLIDEYVRGTFSPARRSEFESHFLASPERRRKVKFARALATVSAENEAVVQPVTPIVLRQNPLLAFFRGLRPAPAFSFAAAVLLFLGAAWLLRDSIILRRELNQLRAENQTQERQRQQLEEQLSIERARNDALAAQVPPQKKEELTPVIPQPQQDPVTTQTKPSSLALLLLPGSLRGSNTVPRLEMTPDARTVRLSVGVDPKDEYKRFRVHLATPQGVRVWSQDNLSARSTRSGRTINLNLPAKLLEPGRYELSLQGTDDGTRVDLSYYYFEVVRK